MRISRFLRAVMAAIAAGLFALGPAQAAGTVEVSYVKPEQFTDIGWGSFERQRSLRLMTQVFQGLGRQLADGQTLKVEVVDIDLAGEIWPRGMHDIRILRGRADWPRVQLRYRLQAAGRDLKSGEQQITDMAYMLTSSLSTRDGSLPYEKRMLERWARDTFGAGH